jgi:hypothetical protein
LVHVHGVRRVEPVSVGVYELVPNDVDLEEIWDEVGVISSRTEVRSGSKRGDYPARLKPCPDTRLVNGEYFSKQ